MAASASMGTKCAASPASTRKVPCQNLKRHTQTALILQVSYLSLVWFSDRHWMSCAVNLSWLLANVLLYRHVSDSEHPRHTHCFVHVYCATTLSCFGYQNCKEGLHTLEASDFFWSDVESFCLMQNFILRGFYWVIQWSWFARMNALCNLSRKKSREVAAHFRADFWVGVASCCV